MGCMSCDYREHFMPAREKNKNSWKQKDNMIIAVTQYKQHLIEEFREWFPG